MCLVREYFHSFLLPLKLQENKENNDVGFLPFSSCGNCPMGKKGDSVIPSPCLFCGIILSAERERERREREERERERRKKRKLHVKMPLDR